MEIPRRVTTVVTCAMLVLFVTALTSCTKYASPDDLQNLDEAKQAAQSAEKELAQMKSDRKKVEMELTETKQELSSAEAEKEAVSVRVKKAAQDEEMMNE